MPSAGKARIVINSQSLRNRSNVISRANTVLTQLIETVKNTCNYPEWPLIESIAEKWRDIFYNAAVITSEGQLIQPAFNPYEGFSGLPVIGTTFVPRIEVFQKIETCWESAGLLTSLIIYGHRCMGKSSILRNLGRSAESNILLVYVDMQNSGWVNHSGELMLDLAEKIHCVVSKAGLDAGPLPSKENYLDIETATHSLETLFDRINSQMEIEYKKDTLFDSGLTEESSESTTSVGDPRKDGAAKLIILAIDEFERIEAGINKNRIDQDLLLYLRYIKDKYKWLGLIFAGLHSLSDMGRDNSSTFYGQAQYLHVGYLTRNEAFRLITHPHPDFALEYDPDLCEELYRLTNGQPYLIQCLCWKLVKCWNERFRKEGESTPRRLSMEYLDRALTGDFYHRAGYYFEDVWTNVNEEERRLMVVIAEREDGWFLVKLKETCLLYLRTDIDKTLTLLRRHDVTKEEKSDANGVKICFASELMRRWVLQKKGEKNNDH